MKALTYFSNVKEGQLQMNVRKKIAMVALHGYIE